MQLPFINVIFYDCVIVLYVLLVVVMKTVH